MAAVDPAAEKGHVRQINPTEGIDRRTGNEWQKHPAHETDAECQQSERRMMRALQELGVIFWRLFFHVAQRSQFTEFALSGHAN